jgi:hypothetical protein
MTLLAMQVGKRIHTCLLICAGLMPTLALASIRVPPGCRSLIKKALHVVRSAEQNPAEVLNLGWRPEQIIEFVFPELGKLNFLRPHPDHYVDRTLSSLMELQRANREILELRHTQNKEQKYDRDALEAKAEIVHQKLAQYFRNIGVEAYNLDNNQYGQPFTYISIKGSHPLNRWARALFFEHNLNVVFYDRKIDIIEDFIHIPADVFNRPNPITHIITKISQLLEKSYNTPIVYFEEGQKRPPRLQDAQGKWHNLDWEDVLNQTLRVNFRPDIKDPEALEKSKQILQHLHTPRRFLEKFPLETRESVRKSLQHHARSQSPLAFVAVEIEGKWYELWPRDFGIPHLSKIDDYEDYLHYSIKNDTFRRKIQFEDEVKFHVVLGSEGATPIDAVDLIHFQDLSSVIEGTLATNKKRRKISINYLKIAMHNHGVLIFEPVPLSINP